MTNPKNSGPSEPTGSPQGAEATPTDSDPRTRSRPTIKDVAARAGVSLGTASRVLTNPPAPSPAAREKVRAAALALGYQVNLRARSLRTARTNAIGLIVPDIRNPFFAGLAQSIQTEGLADGFTVFIASSQEDPDQQDQHLRTLLEEQVDGLIVVPLGGMTPMLDRLRDQQIPFVTVDRTLDGLKAPSVDADPLPGVYAAVEALRDLGHQQIVYVGSLLGSSTGRERLLAFDNASDALLSSTSRMVIAAPLDGDDWLRELDSFLGDGATAVLFGHSRHALRAFGHLRDAGRAIGDQGISLVSFDDLDVFSLLTPAIAAITQHPEQLAGRAMAMLSAMIDGERPGSQRIETSLIPRESLAPPATG